MLFTLYELEVVEETAVKDWLAPPDNRHPFLAASKKQFQTSDILTKEKRLKRRPPVCAYLAVSAGLDVSALVVGCCV